MLYAYRWLQLMAIGHIILGVLFPLLGQIDSVSHIILDAMAPNLILNSSIAEHMTYLITLFGPTVASWGVLLLVLTNNYYQQPNKAQWLGLMLAVLIWFIGDSSYSMLNGVHAAAALNSAVAIMLLIPIWQLRKLYLTANKSHA